MKAEYLNHMGDDLMVVDCARVSFDKKSAWAYDDGLMVNKLKESDVKLIRYLAKHKHISPFFHPQAQFRVTVPFFVANQLKRHQIGFAINEVSRRYVDSDPSFYRPKKWRTRPDKSIKQGSGEGEVSQLRLSDDPHDIIGIKGAYAELLFEAQTLYQLMIEQGVAPEQARMVLPLSAETSWIWTGSLYAWARLFNERAAPNAQQETREIALQISEALAPVFPISWAALTKEGV